MDVGSGLNKSVTISRHPLADSRAFESRDTVSCTRLVTGGNRIVYLTCLGDSWSPGSLSGWLLKAHLENSKDAKNLEGHDCHGPLETNRVRLLVHGGSASGCLCDILHHLCTSDGSGRTAAGHFWWRSGRTKRKAVSGRPRPAISATGSTPSVKDATPARRYEVLSQRAGFTFWLEAEVTIS